jgi:hypothetical protein
MGLSLGLSLLLLLGLSAVNSEELTGYLMDRRCWSMALEGKSIGDGTNPLTAAQSHTLICISMLPCIASGFHIVANSEKKQADDGKTYLYSVLANISRSNTSTVESFLKTFTRRAQIYVTATGSRDAASGDIILSKISDAYIATGTGAAAPASASRFSTAHILCYILIFILSAAHSICSSSESTH